VAELSRAEGRVLQISVSDGGVPKLPVEVVDVGERGIITDRQADLRHHGSEWQALCLFAIEQIQELQDEGHPIAAGLAGENITTEGIDLPNLPRGTRLAVGKTLVIALTEFATPCTKNAQWFLDGDFNRMNDKLHPESSRIYASVLSGGELRTGDVLRVLDDTASERVKRRQPKTVRWPQDFK
jgi:MOSC domain-containing protein YiiM